jgi:hypothetical protein
LLSLVGCLPAGGSLFAQHRDFGVARPGLRLYFGKDGDSLFALLHCGIGLAAHMIQVCRLITQSCLAAPILSYWINLPQ